MQANMTDAASEVFASNRAVGAVKYSCDRDHLDPAVISRAMAL